MTLKQFLNNPKFWFCDIHENNFVTVTYRPRGRHKFNCNKCKNRNNIKDVKIK